MNLSSGDARGNWPQRTGPSVDHSKSADSNGATADRSMHAHLPREGTGQRITLRQFLPYAAREFNVQILHIMSPCRARQYVRPRQALYWIGREVLALNFAQIAQVMDRDHSTVMTGYNLAKKLRAESPEFRAITDRLAAMAPPPRCPCCDRAWPAPELEVAA